MAPESRPHLLRRPFGVTKKFLRLFEFMCLCFQKLVTEWAIAGKGYVAFDTFESHLRLRQFEKCQRRKPVLRFPVFPQLGQVAGTTIASRRGGTFGKSCRISAQTSPYRARSPAQNASIISRRNWSIRFRVVGDSNIMWPPGLCEGDSSGELRSRSPKTRACWSDTCPQTCTGRSWYMRRRS